MCDFIQANNRKRLDHFSGELGLGHVSCCEGHLCNRDYPTVQGLPEGMLVTCHVVKVTFVTEITPLFRDYRKVCWISADKELLISHTPF